MLPCAFFDDDNAHPPMLHALLATIIMRACDVQRGMQTRTAQRNIPPIPPHPAFASCSNKSLACMQQRIPLLRNARLIAQINPQQRPRTARTRVSSERAPADDRTVMIGQLLGALSTQAGALAA